MKWFLFVFKDDIGFVADTSRVDVAPRHEAEAFFEAFEAIVGFESGDNHWVDDIFEFVD